MSDTTSISTSLSGCNSYYPLTPQEVRAIAQLKLSPSACALLLLIKALAPFGNKVMFTDAINPKVMQAELDISRNTFWRAQQALVKRQLIEFNDHYMRDCHTADRAQFKKQAGETKPTAQSSDLPASQDFRLPMPVPTLERRFQSWNNPAPKAALAGHPGKRKDLKTGNLVKTTEHSQLVPTHLPVVSPSSYARELEKTAPFAGQKEESQETVPSLTHQDKSAPQPQKPGSGLLVPGEFSTLEPKLEALGIRFNQNLLREFYRAGFDRVKEAIDYVSRKLQDTPGSIRRVAGYLVELLRNGENLKSQPSNNGDYDREEYRRFIRWVDRAREANVVDASYRDDSGEIVVVISGSGECLPWREAIERYWIDE